MTFWAVVGLVLGIIALLLSAVLFLPVGVFAAFKEDFFVKVSFAGIKLYEYRPQAEEKTAKSGGEAPKEQENKENVIKTLFVRLKEKVGFLPAVKEVMRFAGESLTHIKKLLRHIKIKRICLNLIYGSGDAADTAVKYGEICSAVYPVLALLDTCRNIKFKQINVQSDFTEKRAEFDFSLKVTTRIFYLLIAAVKIFSEYKKFLTRNEL